jgi:membrane protease YdiL (CAAX protease family)
MTEQQPPGQPPPGEQQGPGASWPAPPPPGPPQSWQAPQPGYGPGYAPVYGPGYPPAPGGYAPQGYPPPGQPLPKFPHPEPTPYHEMLRTWSYEVWKPIVGIIIALVGFFLAATIVFLVVAGIAAAFESGSWADNFMASGELKDVGPVELLGLNLGIGSMIFVTWFIMRVLHQMRPRWLTSVVPKMRWKLFAICLGLAAVALLASLIVGMLLPGNSDGDISGKVNAFTRTTALSALVVLLTTPLQAAGEEYLFRGYLLQAVGSLFRNRWVAIVLTALVFALFHGVQNFPLFFDRFAFGLIAAWLVIRTGGLEAGIALHVLNNFLAFGLALTFGDLTETLSISEASWWNILATITQSGVYAVLVLLVARKMGLQTHTRPPSQEPDAAPSGSVGGDLATA